MDAGTSPRKQEKASRDTTGWGTAKLAPYGDRMHPKSRQSGARHRDEHRVALCPLPQFCDGRAIPWPKVWNTLVAVIKRSA